MTPEQLARTVQFIIEHQAQAAIHIEQLSAAFRTEQARTPNMQSLLVTMTELAQVQSRRVDRHDEDFRAIQAQNEDCLARLDQILGRLKDTN